MTTVRVETNPGYDVAIGRGLLDEAGRRVSQAFPNARVALIADAKVDALYGNRVFDALRGAGVDAARFAFEGGETNKTLATVASMLDFLTENAFTRADVVLALGGGIAGDTAGFAAAVYLRGIRCVQMPTTLLAAVDASVGGKTAVNLPGGKNLAGAFHQPSLVLIDPETFGTLPRETYRSGVAEAAKTFLLTDGARFLNMASEMRDEEGLVASCVRAKADFVRRDEFDTGARQLLNLGHTFGHAVEKASGYRVPHGQAVSIGTVMAARCADRIGFSETPCLPAIRDTLAALGLPVTTDFTPDMLLDAMLRDKKRQGGTMRFVLPKRVGACALHTCEVSRVPELLRAACGAGMQA